MEQNIFLCLFCIISIKGRRDYDTYISITNFIFRPLNIRGLRRSRLKITGLYLRFPLMYHAVQIEYEPCETGKNNELEVL